MPAQEVVGIDPLITGIITAIFSGLVVWFIKAQVENIRREKERLQSERKKIYFDVLDPFMRAMTGLGNEAESKKAFRQIATHEYKKKMAFELGMMGSEEVVRAFNELMQMLYKVDEEEDPPTQTLMHKWGELMLAVRRDLTGKKTKLKPVDMLKSWIKDIDSFF